jgi:hypothetical protein
MGDIALLLVAIFVTVVLVRIGDGSSMRPVVWWALLVVAASMTLLGIYTLISTSVAPPPAGKAIFGWLFGGILTVLGAMGLKAGLGGVRHPV